MLHNELLDIVHFSSTRFSSQALYDETNHAEVA